MKRKKGGGGGGANWMDTYGDMVTLLLCFFVLLYSMSTIDSDKMKAIIQSFNPSAILEPTTDPAGHEGEPWAEPQPSGDIDPGVGAEQQDIDEMIKQLYQSLKSYSEEQGMGSTLSVEMDGGKVYIKFNETAFFAGDSYVLRPAAEEVLTRVCEALDQVASAIEEIRIQGHTAQGRSDRPNDAVFDRFLASNRATIVLLFLQQHSTIHPTRLVSEGFGQWRPISPNTTAESRAPNRRVEMIISGRNIAEELAGNGLGSYIDMGNMTN